MTYKYYITLFFACLLQFFAYSQNIEFVENKGQWDNRIQFKGDVSAGSFVIHRDGFTVVQHHPEDWEKLKELSHDHGRNEKNKEGENFRLRSHSYKVQFAGGNPNPEVVPDKAIFTYNNYFIGNDPSKWASNCKIYQGITVKNIYPNIDIRYYSDAGSLKYDLIVKPGGNPNQIAFKYEGADGLQVKNKELIIKTSVGDLKELSPYSYQYGQNQKAEILVKYKVKNNIVQFDVKDYDAKTTLVIDPSLIFCSFSGSTADNWGFTATYGEDGSMFGGGIVWAAGFPVSSGAYQQTYAGGRFDIGIIKLTPDGTSRVYATYIGGSGDDQPHSLIADQAGNLVIAGRTNSNNYPKKGLGSVSPGGGYDIVITKLNSAGSDIIGSTQIGGSGMDGVNISTGDGKNSLQQNYGDNGRSEVILDNAGNIYVASSTQSNNFPVQNAFQSAIGGNQDGVIIKVNSSITTLLFASYLGGPGNDAAYVLSLHPFNNTIYVGGGTESATGLEPYGGSVESAYNGNIDGFVSMITNNGSALIRTTYIGTQGIDQVYGVQFDKSGFPYVMGQTNGNMPMSPAGVWGQANGKQFIAKLQPDLSAYVYRTTFGNGSSVPNISPVAFLVDRCDNVYVSGWGGSPIGGYDNAGVAGLPVTPDAIKPQPDLDAQGKGQDMYFIVIERNAASLLYGTFFGQNGGGSEHVDGGTSRFDRNGVIYQAVCANCQRTGTNIPTTPGAWSTTNKSNNCNLMMIKIAFDFSGVAAGVQSAIGGVPRDTAGCLPLIVDFRDTIANAVSYEWNFGDGSGSVTTTSPNISHTYFNAGIYLVRLISTDSTTCNIRDTSFLNIRVGDLKAQLNFNPVKLNPCDSFKYRFDNLSVAPVSRPFNNLSFVWDFGDGTPRVTAGINPVFHTYPSAGTYNVKLF